MYNASSLILAQRRYYSVAGQYSGELIKRLCRMFTKLRRKKGDRDFVLLHHQQAGVWMYPDTGDNIRYLNAVNHHLH